jgi:hypothetical protein
MSRKPSVMVRIAAAWGVAMAAVFVLGGCQGMGMNGDKADQDAAVARLGKPPDYADVARDYNRTIDFLDRISARANILITYFDEEGNERHEDPEGRLQILRPNKLALSLGKAGQILFWFGCDPEKYWWLDLSEQGKRIAAVGRHENFDDATAARIGLPIKPLDLIRLIGVVKMDVSVGGATQWSNDGRLLGVTTPIGDRGFQRTWVDPKSLRPVTIEIFDRHRDKVLVAEHTGEEQVEITRDVPGARGAHVRVPSRVEITHLETQTKARLTMTGVRDGPITEKAFDLTVLLDKYPVDKTLDLDVKKK